MSIWKKLRDLQRLNLAYGRVMAAESQSIAIVSIHVPTSDDENLSPGLFLFCKHCKQPWPCDAVKISRIVLKICEEDKM